jgi:glutathione S-transferase
MKLYYKSGACSLAPHIVLLEAGLPFTLEPVNLATKVTGSGADYLTINSKGSVPALELDGGQVLTEGPVVMQYIADQKPETGLAPRAGTLERYRLMELLNFVTSEVHKNFSPLFNPATSADWKAAVREALQKKFKWLTDYLGDKHYLMGEQFTVADAYLFTVLSWSPRVGLDLTGYPALAAYVARVAGRPRVQEALRAEGLVK